MTDEGEKYGEIVISDSFTMYGAEIEGIEEVLDDLDMSEEAIYRSGLFEKYCRDYIEGKHFWIDCLAHISGTKIVRLRYRYLP